MSVSTTKDVVHPTELVEEPAEGCFLVDVRTPGEFGGAHIEGSSNFPLGGLKEHAARLRERAAEGKVVLICRTGRRAREAKSLLEAQGLGSLQVLEGGVQAWEQAGLPLRRGREGMSLERQVRIAAGTLVVLGVVLGFLVHPAFFGLSGFVGAGLVFAGVTDTCGMGMLLAKMPWNASAPSE